MKAECFLSLTLTLTLALTLALTLTLTLTWMKAGYFSSARCSEVGRAPLARGSRAVRISCQGSGARLSLTALLRRARRLVAEDVFWQKTVNKLMMVQWLGLLLGSDQGSRWE